MAEHRMEIGLKDQREIATDAIRAAALELLQTGQANPHVLALALALARVAAELGAGAARAGRMPMKAIPGDLADVVRDVG
jgi:hypothetical protein